GFDARDDSSGRAVVVVNETLARRAWPNEDPVGKQLLMTVHDIGPLGTRLTTDTAQTVIGVVRDIKNTSLRDRAEPAVYYSQRQFPFRTMQLVIRGRGTTTSLPAAIRAELRHLDPGLAMLDVKPLGRVLQSSVDPSRFVMLLM